MDRIIILTLVGMTTGFPSFARHTTPGMLSFHLFERNSPRMNRDQPNSLTHATKALFAEKMLSCLSTVLLIPTVSLASDGRGAFEME